MPDRLSSRLAWAPLGAPFFLFFRGSLLLAALFAAMTVQAGDEIGSRAIRSGDLPAIREALIESIEAEGLVVSKLIDFNSMLARTGADLGRRQSPFIAVEIIQFCSSVIAWQLIEESPAQVALCPLSMTLQRRHADPETVWLSWREPQPGTPGRARAVDLLRRLADRTAELAE